MRWFALALLAGCGPKIDPLAAAREQARQRASVPVTGEAPRAKLRVGAELLDRLASELIVLEPMTIQTGFLPVVVNPELEFVKVSVTGDGPIGLVADGSGKATIVTPLLSPTVEFQAELAGDLEFESKEGKKGLTVSAVWADADAVTAEVSLMGLPPQLAGDAQSMVADEVRKAAVEALGKPRVLEIPTVEWGSIREISPAGEGDLFFDVVLDGLGGFQPIDLPAPGDGWIAGVSPEAALALARRAAYSLPPDAKVQLDPIAVSWVGEEITAVVDVYRPARKERRRRYRVSGMPRLIHGHLSMVVSELELVDKSSWGRGLRVMIGEGRVQKLMAEGVTVPTSAEAKVGERTLVVGIERLEFIEGGVLVHGQATVEESP